MSLSLSPWAYHLFLLFLPKTQMEMELLDENISLWSAGKETNIRLLLSTLHYVKPNWPFFVNLVSPTAQAPRLYISFHLSLWFNVFSDVWGGHWTFQLTHNCIYFGFGFQILWPTSGWYAIPLTSLIESSQVKKAYQKARLCLHPDKLQQRGATLKQKYVAEKAFSILQVKILVSWERVIINW